MGEEHSKLSGGNFDEQMEQDGKMQYRRWGGRGLKGTRMEVPPPFAILQASRGAKRTRISWQVEPRGGVLGLWVNFL